MIVGISGKEFVLKFEINLSFLPFSLFFVNLYLLGKAIFFLVIENKAGFEKTKKENPPLQSNQSLDIDPKVLLWYKQIKEQKRRFFSFEISYC